MKSRRLTEGISNSSIVSGIEVSDDGGAVLACRIVQLNRALELSCEFLNNSSRSLLVCTSIASSAEAGENKQAYCYVDLDGAVHITKRLWCVPEDLDVYAPQVPLAALIKPGERLSEEISLSLPLIINFPYRLFRSRRDADRYSTIECDELIISIGYFYEDELLLGGATIGNVNREDLHVVNYDVGSICQRLIQVGFSKLRVIVKDIYQEVRDF